MKYILFALIATLLVNCGKEEPSSFYSSCTRGPLGICNPGNAEETPDEEPEDEEPEIEIVIVSPSPSPSPSSSPAPCKKYKSGKKKGQCKNGN